MFQPLLLPNDTITPIIVAIMQGDTAAAAIRYFLDIEFLFISKGTFKN